MRRTTDLLTRRRTIPVCVALLCCALGGCGFRNVDAVHFTQAEYRIESPGIVVNRPAPEMYRSPPDAKWSIVTLPHLMPRPIAGPGDIAATVWVTHWYRLRWQSREANQRALALYIPRQHMVIGNLDIYVDGTHVDSTAIPNWNTPQMVLLPPMRGLTASLESPSSIREILIGLSGEPAGGGALSSVWVGPASELHGRFEIRDFLQRGIPQITSVAFLAFGAFALVFWWQRRSEKTYLYFGLLAPVYCLRTLHYYVSDERWLTTLFWWMTVNSLSWLQVLVYFFAASLHGQRFPRIERIVVGTIVAASVLSLLSMLSDAYISDLAPLLYLVQMLASVVAITLTTVGAFRSRMLMAKMIAAMLWIFLMMGVHDWLLQNWRINIESIYLLPYGSILVLGAALYAIFHRYIVAVNEADRLNASLEQRLNERSRELEESHRKLRLIEQEQAVTGERQRLMREMHDGLGSSLMSSLVMVEQGKLDSSQVATVLRESIDDLKLTIDSLEPMGDDLLTLLGTLRYRLGKRLEAAGLKLEWRVLETPPLPWLNPTSSLQILRILQESLTNTLKHAQATAIRVETDSNATEVSIRLIDNGRGFDVAAEMHKPQGRGLQNLRRRAATLGGKVEMASRPGHTEITLRLPIERRVQPRPAV